MCVQGRCPGGVGPGGMLGEVCSGGCTPPDLEADPPDPEADSPYPSVNKMTDGQV